MLFLSVTAALLVVQAAVFALALATRVHLAMENARRAGAQDGGWHPAAVDRTGRTSASAKVVAVIPNDSIWFEYVL